MDAKPECPDSLRIFVKNGATKRFRALKEKSAGLPVTIAWDRRKGDPRASERSSGIERKGERRSTPPFTWELADFVLVQEPSLLEGIDTSHLDLTVPPVPRRRRAGKRRARRSR